MFMLQQRQSQKKEMKDAVLFVKQKIELGKMVYRCNKTETKYTLLTMNAILDTRKSIH